ncbi:MAG TPA: hypothetical protein VIW73_02260 [Candidatus Cybelea sp.]
MSAVLGPTSGWLALGAIPVAAAAGWILRRFIRGRFSLRMRPHYVIGYAVLALAIVHLSFSMRAMAGTNATGLWLASLALLGLIWQVLLGSNLQSPGGYRTVLRRWHLGTFAAVMLLAAGHALLNR